MSRFELISECQLYSVGMVCHYSFYWHHKCQVPLLIIPTLRLYEFQRWRRIFMYPTGRIDHSLFFYPCKRS
jgi:hypothetical protein